MLLHLLTIIFLWLFTNCAEKKTDIGRWRFADNKATSLRIQHLGKKLILEGKDSCNAASVKQAGLLRRLPVLLLPRGSAPAGHGGPGVPRGACSPSAPLPGFGPTWGRLGMLPAAGGRWELGLASACVSRRGAGWVLARFNSG